MFSHLLCYTLGSLTNAGNYEGHIACEERGRGIDACLPGNGFEGSPSVFEEGMEPEPHASIIAAVQTHMPQIQEELREFSSNQLSRPMGAGEDITRPGRGWVQMYIWTRGDGWRVHSCKWLGTICGVLNARLPTTQLPLTSNIQTCVELFGLRPGAHLEKHWDGGEGRVCSLICISGCDRSTWMNVYDEQGTRTYRFSRVGQSVTFDSLYEHEAGHDGQAATRWALSVCLPHPGYAANFAQISNFAHVTDRYEGNEWHECLINDAANEWHYCDAGWSNANDSDPLQQSADHTVVDVLECLPLDIFRKSQRWKRVENTHVCAPTTTTSRTLVRQLSIAPSLCVVQEFLPTGFDVCLDEQFSSDSFRLNEIYHDCFAMVNVLWVESFRDGIFLDVGNTIGLCAVAILAAGEGAGGPSLIISIVPDPLYMAQMMRTRSLLPLALQRRWVLFQVSPGEKRGTQNALVKLNSLGHPLMRSSSVPVSRIALDSLFRRFRRNSTAVARVHPRGVLPDISLMHMGNVENQLSTLRGMRRLLQLRVVRCLKFDFSPATMLFQGIAPHDVLNELLQANYQIHDAQNLHLQPVKLARLQELACAWEWRWTLTTKRDFKFFALPLPSGLIQSQRIQCNLAAVKTCLVI